jgi:hypothetical protein
MDENSQDAGQAPVISPTAPTPAQRGGTFAFAALFVIGLLIYTFCLFKNISYPLMWADESMTAVGAQRVLEFGYPKVHDGRNIFYDLRHSDMTLGIDKKTDAYIGGAGWTPYYFAAPFVALSQSVSGLYLKTAILRVPFAIAGLAGMLLLLWTGTSFLPTAVSRFAVAALFVVLELPGVTLMLHLREVRYYSLLLLLTSVAITLFAAYHLRSSISYRIYAVALFCLVPLLFLTFSPASVAFCGTICIYLGGEWLISRLREREGTHSSMNARFKALYPMLASLLLVAPLAWFFRTLYISRKLEEFYEFTFSSYLEHVGVAWDYLFRFEILAFAIAAKLIIALYWKRMRDDIQLHPAVRLSLLLSIYFVATILLIGKVPNPIFTRYFITLQPLLVVSFALDLWILARLALGMIAWKRTAVASLAAVLLTGSVGWAFSQNRSLVRGRLYEISNQYQGVLDFVIPYIRERYEHPERLVIATNYEETSYEFYLGCRVIVGFLTPNLTPDLMERPDCIVYREFWAGLTDKSVYEYLLRRDVYEMVRFPVFDYGFNNIPETVHWTPRWGWEKEMHLFKTFYTDVQVYQTTLYLLKDDAAKSPDARKRNDDAR